MRKYLIASLLAAQTALAWSQAHAESNGNKLFKIERFYENSFASIAILSVKVPSTARYVDGQCVFTDRDGKVLEIGSITAFHDEYETVYGPLAATDVECKLRAK